MAEDPFSEYEGHDKDLPPVSLVGINETYSIFEL